MQSVINNTFIWSQRLSFHVVITCKSTFSSLVFFFIFIWALLKHYAFTLVYKLPDYSIQFKKKRKRKSHYFGNSKWNCNKCITFGITYLCYFFLISYLSLKRTLVPHLFNFLLGHLLLLRKGILSFHFQVLIFKTEKR